ncbi:unnamed protein product [Hydatigera taeniaeformis]|uniref:Uncharacterized protein n=1 Tax=Hydatigena taeniaeformis TaxID=6205 RepID=A0A3P7FCP0_HYDTA|nr:unnamed protein product [Hydatigera taeniaeformis]
MTLAQLVLLAHRRNKQERWDWLAAFVYYHWTGCDHLMVCVFVTS